MESLGYIRKDNNKNRALEIVDRDVEKYDIPKKELSSVPLLGSIAAGMPVLAVENVEDLLPVPVEWLDNNDSFALKVKGDSMINAGIFDGDLVIISSRNVAGNGEIVAAIIEDEVTLKTFYKEKDHIRLQPENDDYEPIISRDVKIMGVLKLLIRNY